MTPRTVTSALLALGAFGAFALSPGCTPAPVAASDDVPVALPRPYAYVVGEDGLVPLGPLRDDGNRFVLPLATLSERVPRPRVTGRGVEVVFAAGDALLSIGRVSARAVTHGPRERVLLTQDGPRRFGAPRLPRRTEPTRALAALARQDGALTGRTTVTLECEPAGAALVFGHGEWGAGDGANTARVTLDGAPVTLALGPNDVFVAPAKERHVLDLAACPLDHVSLRDELPLDLAAAPTLALRDVAAAPVDRFDLARTGGLGVFHPVPTLAAPGHGLAPAQGDEDGPPRQGAGASAAFERVDLRRGDTLRLAFAAPAVDEGQVATIVLDIDVLQGGFAEAVPQVLALPDDGWLRDVARDLVADGDPGLLVHFEGPDEQLDIRPTMGPGAAWGDFDGDGWQDLYLVQGAGRAGSEANPNRLLRSLGATRAPNGPWFEDVTERAGVGDTGAGMGALFVDLDGDGDLDLYVANQGPDALYLNRGDGTFADARDLLPGHDLWSAGVAAADTDRDGDLDLYVTSYLEYDVTKMPPAEELGRYQREDPVEMLPFAFPGQRNVFLRNDGVGPDGRPRFTDTTEALGLMDVPGRGMQPVFWDFDRDGDQDLYIANDVSYNVLYRNEGDGTFKDVSFATGLDDPRGGMGLAAADVDADGDEDMFLTNWQLDANALYINNLAAPFETRTRRAAFQDAAVRAGLARPSMGLTSWGVALFDLELDGDLDAFVANGYTSPDYVSTGVCVGQPNHLYRNDGTGRFSEAHELAAAALGVRLASRGAAPCDFDRDGDVDVLVTANNGPTQLLANEAPRAGAWLGLALRQPGANGHAIGAEVTVRVEGPSGSRTFRRALRAGEGYLTGNPAELHFGLGDATRVLGVDVVWPDGTASEHSGVALGRWQTITR